MLISIGERVYELSAEMATHEQRHAWHGRVWKSDQGLHDISEVLARREGAVDDERYCSAGTSSRLRCWVRGREERVCPLQGWRWLVRVTGREADTFRLMPPAQLRSAARSRTAVHHGI